MTKGDDAMFDNVLVGVDGRPNGRDAIALAERLAGPDGALTLAHVHRDESNPLKAVQRELLREERATSQGLLAREMAAAQVRAQLASVVASSPGAGLHEQAERQSADLLVVGSCGRGLLGRAMLGDDTRGSLNGASCAVAVAARGYAEHPTVIATIGVAYNGSPESETALAYARRLAGATRARIKAHDVVTIPSVAFTGMVTPAIGDSVDALLEQARERIEAIADIEGKAIYGLPGEELAMFSSEVDLLVVGSRSYGPVKRLVLGSTSDYLARHTRCSLLVLPRANVSEAEAPHTDTELAVGI
jgi:nucleotide-binding universal stress UspA family protein